MNAVAVLALAFAAGSAAAQGPPGLDRSRNNLVYPPGYDTVTTSAGRTEIIGSGTMPLVFVAGWGFSADAFRPFAQGISAEYTSYLVTLPGLGGTPGWPMPADSVSHATTPWVTRSAAGVARMMADHGISGAIVIGHFIIGTHVVLELAQQHPERIRGVVLVGGELSRFWPSRADSTGRTPSTPAQRAASVDRWLVPQFFRYVTDSTWHGNNYLPHTFSVDSVRAARLWREQAAVPLPIMIRYLADFYATEFAPKLDSIGVPLLVVVPGFDSRTLSDARTPYLKPFFHDSWEPARGHDRVEIRTIADAAVFVWLDQEERFRAELGRFAERTAQH